MSSIQSYLLEDFFAVGISYKNSDANTRGQFSVSIEQYEKMIELAPLFMVDKMFILSTCNRTEIYGFAKEASCILNLFKSLSSGDFELFNEIAVIKNGLTAVSHLYDVGCGLDSQILGDYEIVSQLKLAVNFAREKSFLGSFLERLVGSVLASSKKVKNNTALSSGSVSVSFSAAKFIKQKSHGNDTNKILVLGAGKIGRNTCKNLLGHFKGENITVINRSVEKAEQLAQELKINFNTQENLALELLSSNIILVATNAIDPVILKSCLINTTHKKLIIDISMPCNVEVGVGDLPNIEVIHVDQVSKIKDDNLKKRLAEVPKARVIIQEHINELIEWHTKREKMSASKNVEFCEIY
jgi:glutamyl-tRNA reductase